MAREIIGRALADTMRALEAAFPDRHEEILRTLLASAEEVNQIRRVNEAISEARAAISDGVLDFEDAVENARSALSWGDVLDVMALGGSSAQIRDLTDHEYSVFSSTIDDLLGQAIELPDWKAE